MQQSARFVCVGGGTGLFTVLTGLKGECPRADLSAIVSMMDSGGSTGRLRHELGVLPPGDVRKCLIALSDAPRDLLELMRYRFDCGEGLSGHALGNLILAAARDVAGDEYAAIELLERILLVRGHVYPVTLDNAQLVADLADGRRITGEAEIDRRTDDCRTPISGIYLSPCARLFEKARQAMLRADYIVVGPGDLYTSVLPNLAVEGFVETVAEAQRRGARLVYVTNTMTKHGETDGYSARRFVDVVAARLEPARLDAVVVNVGEPPSNLAAAYARELAEPVVDDLPRNAGYQVLARDLMCRSLFARHDPGRLACALSDLAVRLPRRVAA